MQAGSRSGCLKKGGWNPLANYGKCEEVYTSTKDLSLHFNSREPLFQVWL